MGQRGAGKGLEKRTNRKRGRTGKEDRAGKEDAVRSDT
jgi:hypothetical protein